MVPDMTIGQYSVPFLLTIVLGLIYKFIPVIADRYKALVAIVFGVALAIVSMFFSAPETVTFQMWVNSVIGGLLIGASAVGLYEAQRTVTKPRE